MPSSRFDGDAGVERWAMAVNFNLRIRKVLRGSTLTLPSI